MYGSDTASTQELAKGYTRPIASAHNPYKVSGEIIDANETLLAKRKLAKILRSKALVEPLVTIGDMIDVFIKLENEKRGKWFSSKIVLAYDHESGIETLAGAASKPMTAAVEDNRPSITGDLFSREV